MKGINVKVQKINRISNINQISIKDELNDVEIDDSKWDSLFDYLASDASVIYFSAFELNYYRDDFSRYEFSFCRKYCLGWW